MASSSSSSDMALPRANGSKYDVFLSFRGEDTRHSFTDHLYNALKQAGILTFRDSDDAERGEQLKEEIKKAIKASDASIIVLSGNYATSTWCLDELSLILDQRRDRNHFVLPIFYHVDPSHVGKQEGSFMIAAGSSQRWTVDNVKRWKAALTEVVSVIGMSLLGSESKFIKEVVDTIYNRLDRKKIYIPPNITGMDARYKQINSWIEQYKTQFLVIHGMAGSGKSALAKYIVHSDGQRFESYSIIDKIGSRCKNSHEMVVLQEQLCSDITKGKLDRKIDTVCEGTAQIEVLLEIMARSLIVLDEIDKESQLEDLLGSGNINKESKIIITTENDLSNWFRSKTKKFHQYEMRLLKDDEALELLSLHAFRSKIPKDGYNDLAQQVVRYCGGSPLALEVLGSSLSEKDTISSWETEVRLIKEELNDDIYGVYVRSYYSLPRAYEKELFLHIACFFVGKDMDYVVKILQPDYGAESILKTLIKRCLLYITPDKKLTMHRLLQDMGKKLVDRESRLPDKRSRVWRNRESYEMLTRKKSSDTIEGLALDFQKLMKEDGLESRKLKELTTDSLQRMDRLKLLQLNFVKLTGSYEDLSENLRWLCWFGFNQSTMHTQLFIWNMVALDMSYSCLEKFEPPMDLPSLKILNLKDSHNLLEIRKLNYIPNLETLILWNCDSLVYICETIGNHERLALLNMTGCKSLFERMQINTSAVDLKAFTSGGGRTQELSFSLPHSLQRVFFDNCNLECTDYLPLSFSDQSCLQYINLGSGVFEILPSYNHLKKLRVLDLRKCSKLKRLFCLPSTLSELYIDDCKSIEKITFESGRFTLQEFGYEGCVILSEIEGLLKLLLLTKLDETDLGHLIWLKEYQKFEVFLVGDYELTKGRSSYLQMLYEFDIMSISLPDVKHPKLMPEYTSTSTSLSFEVPLCEKNRRLKGLNVTFRYTISGEDCAWFCKISITNGDEWIYNPKVFGKPASGEVCIWLSYWPIGNTLNVGDVVNVSIVVVMSGLEVLECGVSLVCTDEDVAGEILDNKIGWVGTYGKEMSRFQLSKGSYYLCHSDFYKSMEVGRLALGWLRNLVGDSIDDTEVRGWRMCGRPQQSYQSFSELKTVGCVIHVHEREETNMIGEIPDLPIADKNVGYTSSRIEISEYSDTEIEYVDAFKDAISETNSAQPCRRFSREEIQLATRNFDEDLVIGRGESGMVYKGQIRNEEISVDVAIKWFNFEYDEGPAEFKAEIEMLFKLRHIHLVTLIGYCYCEDYKEMFVVYEYTPNGTLYDHLHKTETPLNWMQRIKIATGAARGLDYLHTGSGTPHGIIHGEVKSSNILLDANWEAMILDFGLPKFLDPHDPSLSNYYDTRLTRNTDVYAFGVLLFELLSGRRAADDCYGEEECSLVRWAKKCVRERKMDEMVDSKIRGTIAPKCLKQFVQLADRCLLSVPKKRPTMSEVVASLQEILELQVKNDDLAKSSGETSSGTAGFRSKMKKFFHF